MRKRSLIFLKSIVCDLKPVTLVHSNNDSIYWCVILDKPVRHIVIVGGGTAGWLVAGILAADHNSARKDGLNITLIESPDVPTIGVGEGTWPTMRETLRKIGLSETEFLRECDGAFKQGSRFDGWVTGEEGDRYYHPFVLPNGYGGVNLVPGWQQLSGTENFADAMSFQSRLCDAGKAPKQTTTPEYAAVANYAYHLDAGKFAALLQRHCTEKLGVRHILDHVTAVNASESGDIASLGTKNSGVLEGDLFVDCTGMSSMLLGKHFGVGFVDKKGVLFNDTALAVQVPYADESASIASQTISTATAAGWIWDIGLPTRRGIGHVYSSAHMDDETAEQKLHDYIADDCLSAGDLLVRKISFRPGHRKKFWHRNCVAVGMAAGFLEPLEASALVLVELSAKMISHEMPANRHVMDMTAQRFNERFLYRWDRIIDFLKLHYVLSKRTDSAYWTDNRSEETVTDRLQALLELWRFQPPSAQDFTQIEEVFPSASYQYVLYGMGFDTIAPLTSRRRASVESAQRYFSETDRVSAKYLAGLPSNRELIDHIKAYGLPQR